ncbi:hypothetical protein ACFSKW_45130 [Nonomuraea mangrovi]|uniref:Uncharacterized protein n=1 Tax=Nonomuraea mangrovi TaxID=2316207 RepID=A0ABW4T9G1_9ACTN
MAKHEAFRHEGSVKLGFAMLGIGVVLLLCWLVASSDAEEPRCGGERMTSGDWCSSRRSGPSSFEERQANAAAAAFWLLRIGGVLTVGGAGLLVAERTTRSIRAGATPWARARRQREAEEAAAARAAARAALPPVSRDQLVLEIRAIKLPLASRPGYDPRAIDALLSRLVTRLETEPDTAKSVIPPALSFDLAYMTTSPGYDKELVEALLRRLRDLLDRKIV